MAPWERTFDLKEYLHFHKKVDTKLTLNKNTVGRIPIKVVMSKVHRRTMFDDTSWFQDFFFFVLTRRVVDDNLRILTVDAANEAPKNETQSVYCFYYNNQMYDKQDQFIWPMASKETILGMET